jgi:hypothetical protein
MPGIPMSAAQCQKRMKHVLKRPAARDAIAHLEEKARAGGAPGQARTPLPRPTAPGRRPRARRCLRPS